MAQPRANLFAGHAENFAGLACRAESNDHERDLPSAARFVVPNAAPPRSSGLALLLLAGVGNNRRAKFCERTRAGRRQLGEATAHWSRIALAIAQPLEA
jgi:hypothetical protein